MIKDFTKGVFSLKFSVFSDGGVRSLEGVDFELIRIPGFGRYRKPTEGIGRQKFSDCQIFKLSDREDRNG
jgi:hypothetical protein